MTETLAEATGKENTEIVDKKVINKDSDEDVIVLIKYEDVMIPVHQFKLTTHSKVFGSIFDDKWEDNNTVMSNGQEKIVVYHLLIEDIESAAVKYLFEDLEVQGSHLRHDTLTQQLNYLVIVDILRLIDFYMIETMFPKYKDLMKNYKPTTLNQHLDVYEGLNKAKLIGSMLVDTNAIEEASLNYLSTNLENRICLKNFVLENQHRSEVVFKMLDKLSF